VNACPNEFVQAGYNARMRECMNERNNYFYDESILSNIQNPEINIKYNKESSIKYPVSSIKYQVSRIKYQE
jgi:hypothetical protein